MRTKEIEVFTFDELSEVVRRRLIEEFSRGVDLSHMVELFEEQLEDLGFENIQIRYSGFYSQGDGASFSAWKGGNCITSFGRYCHANTMACDNTNLLRYARGLANAFYVELTKEYEWQTSYEQVRECILLNEYDFDKNGRIV